MSRSYLLDYLKDSGLINQAKLDLLKYELDQRIYYYGNHFKHSKENEIICSKTLKWNCRYLLQYILIYVYIIFYLLFKDNKRHNKKTIISNAYFSVNEELKKLGFDILRPIHNLIVGGGVQKFKIIREFTRIDRKIRIGNFNYLLSDNFLKELDLFENDLMEYYKSINVDALVVSNDISFFEQLNIRIFKKLGKPSFIFLHGLPGRYNIYDDSQADYLIVWGEKIKQNYIDAGFKSDKILVSGHPFYSQLPNQPLRNSFENILVVSKSLHGAQQRDEVRIADRGGIIVYLNQIADALKKLGVQGARLRVHPSENINWYFKFIDKEFFVEDNEPLQESLQKTTLVVGPTSTIFLESIYYGVNYLVYEPTVGGVDLSGYPPVNPFDGSDSRVPVAKDEKELEKILIEKKIINKSVFNDYISTPFDIKKIRDLI